MLVNRTLHGICTWMNLYECVPRFIYINYFVNYTCFSFHCWCSGFLRLFLVFVESEVKEPPSLCHWNCTQRIQVKLKQQFHPRFWSSEHMRLLGSSPFRTWSQRCYSWSREPHTTGDRSIKKSTSLIFSF